MKFFTIVVTGMSVALSGCVGLPPKAAPAHIYSPTEKLRPGPWQGLDVNGEAGYCAEVYSARVFGGASKEDRGAQFRRRDFDEFRNQVEVHVALGSKCELTI